MVSIRSFIERSDKSNSCDILKMLKPYFDEPKDRDFLNRYFFGEYVDNLRQHIPAPRPAKGVKNGILRVASYNIQ